MYEKYGELIDALEAEDYEKAADYISSLMPEPEVEEVALTIDNWSDYFYIYRENSFEKDAYGTNLTENSNYYIAPKPEYENAVLDNVIAGFEYNMQCYQVVNLDKEEGTYDTAPVDDSRLINDTYISSSTGQFSKSSEVNGKTFLVSFRYFPLDLNGQIRLTGGLELQNADDYSMQLAVMPDHIDIVSFSGSISITK